MKGYSTTTFIKRKKSQLFYKFSTHSNVIWKVESVYNISAITIYGISASYYACKNFSLKFYSIKNDGWYEEVQNPVWNFSETLKNSNMHWGKYIFVQQPTYLF